jgi:hypothetical protein
MDQPDHACAPDACFHRITSDLAQEIRDNAAGAMTVEQDFGMRVQVLPKRNDLGQKGGNSFLDRHCVPRIIWTRHKIRRKVTPDQLEALMPQQIANDQPPDASVSSQHDRPTPVIVFGALRSGTTLLRLMLNAHPDLNNPGEVDFLTDHIWRAPDAPTGWRYDKAALASDRMFTAQAIEIPNDLDGLDLMDALLFRLAAKSRGLLCVSMHRDLALALQLLPGSRVIHLLRDPRDVARSSLEMGWAGTLYHAADHWVRSEFEWDRVCRKLAPEDWIELRFEALMHAPEQELERLCSFLGVGYSSKMLSYPEHSTYGPPNPVIAGQWAHRCKPGDVADLESKIADMMSARGYSPGVTREAPGPLRRAWLAVQHRLGMWRFGVRHYGVVPFFGARVAHKLRMRGLQRYFQSKIDKRIRQMLR